MLNLQDVTLMCVDTNKINRAYSAILQTLSKVSFEEVIFFTDVNKSPVKTSPKMRILHTPEVVGTVTYSRFMITQLAKYITTKHVLVIQWDGYVLNENAWTDEFLNYDYIGARWFWHKDNNRVGNGGFSLRSKKLTDLTAELYYNKKIIETHPEDSVICRDHRATLEYYGIKYAPEELALQFSVENEPYTSQFGWHGGSTAPKH